MLADASIENYAQDIQQGRAAQDVQVCPDLAFFLDQSRQCQHNRDARYENKQRENEIVKGEPFPLHVFQLGPEEVADRAWCGALVAQHPLERPDRAVGADDPEYAEPTQCIDRHDAAGLQCERHFCITHRTPCSFTEDQNRTKTDLLKNSCVESSLQLWRTDVKTR